MRAEYSGKICVVTGAVFAHRPRALLRTSPAGRGGLYGRRERRGAFANGKRIQPFPPRRAFSVPTDVTQPLDAQRLVDVALSRKGRLDCLMMAGAAPCSAPIGQVMAESWRYAIDVNLMGVVYMVEAALPAMRAHGHGRIALLLPMSGLLPAPLRRCAAPPTLRRGR
jgi:NAD(P)-dependent dehydrogenase (short-subunit alcohol dehydrogenase family)